MHADEFIAARVTTDTKDRFRALAERLELSESVLLRRLIEQSVEGVERPQVFPPPPPPRHARLTVRVRPDDRVLREARARARAMPPSTYVSVLLRSHLRILAPLPEAELRALREAVTRLSEVGQALRQIARSADRGGPIAGLDRQGFIAFLRIADGLRDSVKGLLKTNLESWTKGYTDGRE